MAIALNDLSAFLVNTLFLGHTASWSSSSMSWPCWEERCPKKTGWVFSDRAYHAIQELLASHSTWWWKVSGLFSLNHQDSGDGRTLATLMAGPPSQGPGYVSRSRSGWENKASGTLQIMWVSVAIFLQRREDPRRP